jgi:hypothetical protein
MSGLETITIPATVFEDRHEDVPATMLDLGKGVDQPDHPDADQPDADQESDRNDAARRATDQDDSDDRAEDAQQRQQATVARRLTQQLSLPPLAPPEQRLSLVRVRLPRLRTFLDLRR